MLFHSSSMYYVLKQDKTWTQNTVHLPSLLPMINGESMVLLIGSGNIAMILQCGTASQLVLKLI